MSNSATSAAKRRRAGPLLSSPLFQPPQSFQSNKPIPDNNLNLQPDRPQPSFSEPQSQVPDSKFMTVQQVINLITTRLIAVENFVTEFGDKPRQFNTVVPSDGAAPVSVDYNKITEICKSLVDEHISEFDHRYAVLAEEISNLKNIVLNLQSYTMEVNKVLLEERAQKTETDVEEVKNEYANDDVPNIEFQFESEASEELVSAEPLVMDETQSEPLLLEQTQSEPLLLERTHSEPEPLEHTQLSLDETPSDKDESPSEEAAEDPFSINIVSKKNKKGGKKSKAVEQEQQLLA